MRRNIIRGLAFTLLVALFLFSGCSSMKGKTDVSLSKIPFEILLEESNRTAWKPSDRLKELYVPITKAGELRSYLDVKSDDPISAPFPPTELKQINFDREITVFLTRGLQTTGFYKLKIGGIERGNRTVYIRVVKTDPQGPAPDVMEYRITLLKIAKENLPKGTVQILFTDESGNILSKKEITV